MTEKKKFKGIDDTPETIKAFDKELNNKSLIKELKAVYTDGNRNQHLPILEQHLRYLYDMEDPYIRSCKQAYTFLRVTSSKFLRYAQIYVHPDHNKTYKELFDERRKILRRENYRKRLEKYKLQQLQKWHQKKFIDSLNNNDHQNVKHVNISTIKRRLVSHGIKEECAYCGFHERSISKDEKCKGRVPLLLDHINEDYNDWRVENLQFLCFNCFFNLVGNPVEYYKKNRDYVY